MDELIADRLNQVVVWRNTDTMPDGDWPERIYVIPNM